jgi:hypothetical protein
MASMTELITPKQQGETHSAVERIGAFAVALTRPSPVHRYLSENSPRYSMTVQCR